MKNAQVSLLASVLICTRNRAAYLGNTIREAAAQTLSAGVFEIVVVDNGSTDHTPEVVRESQITITNVTLRYVVEEEVGLSAARNRAIREAKGQILCFLDDDAVPEPEWLEWLVSGYTGNSRVMCVGGAIVPVFETALPEWFPKDLEFLFKPEIRGIELHQVTYPHYPYGANFSIRAEAVKHVGVFNTSLGYKGRNLIPCEETEFLLRLEKSGCEILMEPRSVVRHIIPANRISRDYLRLRHYANGQGYALLDYIHRAEPDEGNETFFGQVRKLFVLYVNNFLLRVRYWLCLTRNFRTIQSKLFLRQCYLAEDLGRSDQVWKLLWYRFRGRPIRCHHRGTPEIPTVSK